MTQKFRSEEFEIGEVVNDEGAFVVDNSRSGYLTIEYPDGTRCDFISGGDIWVAMAKVEEWNKALADPTKWTTMPEGMTPEEMAEWLMSEDDKQTGANDV